MVKAIRLYSGVTELNYSEATIDRTEDEIVDSATATIEANVLATIGSTLLYKQQDGSTTQFAPKIKEIKKDTTWTIKALANGYEMHKIRIEKVYTTTSPEAIVQDIVDNFTTTLTYASVATSGVTLDKYLAKGYAIDIIKDMMDVLQWQLRIDKNDNVYFEPKGYVDNGRTYTNGSNCQIENWKEDTQFLVNHVKIVGGFENHLITETVTGTGTTFSLSKKPFGAMQAVVSAAIVDPSLYTVNAEDQTIEFTTSRTDPTFTYTYNTPVVVENQEDLSIATYGESFKEISAPWLNTFSEARKYSQAFLDVFSVPFIKALVQEPGLNFDIDVGELVQVQDPIRGLYYNLATKRIKLIANQNISEYEVGTRDFMLYDWQREVQDRIKKLERKTSNETTITMARLFKHEMSIAIEETRYNYYKSSVDSFVMDSDTLSFLRSGMDIEIDCSLSSNHGTWSGTGVTTGSQYHKGNLVCHLPMNNNSNDASFYNNNGADTSMTYSTGLQFNAATFDGTSSLITIANDADMNSAAFSVAFWIKADTLRKQGIISKNTGGAGNGWKIWMDDNTGIMKAEGTGSVGTVATSATAADAWTHIAITYDGSNLKIYKNGALANTATGVTITNNNTHNTILGFSETDRLDGKIDDFRFYGIALTLADITAIYNTGTGTEANVEHYRLESGDFNGSDRYVTVTDTASLRLGTDFSIGLAIKVSALPGAIKPILIKTDLTNGWKIETTASNQIKLSFYNSGSLNSITSTTALTINKFYHFMFTKSGNNYICYVDGVSDNTATGAGNCTSYTGDMIIGKNGADYFTGYLDDVMIYSDAKSAVEVLSIKNKIVNRTNMIEWLGFDNPLSGDRSTDKIGIQI